MDKLSKTMTDKIDKVTLPIRLDIQLSPKVSETTKTLTEKLSGQEKSLNEKIYSSTSKVCIIYCKYNSKLC